jgi:hypothetical protein
MGDTMRTLLRASLTASTAIIALWGVAAAQSPATYNGTYAGVSAVISSGDHCPTPETPSALTITNGNALSASGNFTGTVDGSGHIVLHTKDSNRYEGQIDGAGVIKVGGGGTRCTYTLTWKKR